MTFSRRKFFSMLAALASGGALFSWLSPSQAAPYFSYVGDDWGRTDWDGKTEHWTVVSAEGFAELKDKLSALPNQCDGSPTAICEATGEPYVEIHCAAIARPGDEVAVERVVARKMAFEISKAMINRRGKIYWRIPFETEISQHQEFAYYVDGGPDVDFVTNQRGYADKNWKKVSAYVRFTRAKV